MRSPRQPRFFGRQSYRRRRLIDAARLLPLVGLFFVLLPILWRPAATPEADTAPGGIYIFVIWAVMILLALVLSWLLNRVKPEGSDTPHDEMPDERRPGPG